MTDHESWDKAVKAMRDTYLIAARDAEQLTYRHWDAWRDSSRVGTRKLALKAKCHGICAFDRMLRLAYKNQEGS